MLQQMTFKEIAIHSQKKTPAIVLQDQSGNTMPIYVGEDQARAIIGGTELVDKPTRPLTHDLFANVLASWSLDLDKVVINAVNDNNTYLATLIVKQGDITKEIDCRPSDRIAGAVRVNSPIFVSQTLIQDNSIATAI